MVVLVESLLSDRLPALHGLQRPLHVSSLCAGNGVGDEGAAALAEALKENSTVTTINLSSKHLAVVV